MKNIIIKTQKLDDQVDLQELASLTVDLWKKIRPELDPSADRLMQWMKNLKYTHPPVIVKAYKEEVLVGWLMLFKQDTKMLEINPWALGGHPHIIHNHPNEIEIARLLLNSCVEYAETNEYTRVEILFDKKDNERNYPVELEIYSDRYLLEEDEIQYMSRSIEIHEYSMPKFPEGIKIVPFMDCSQEDLYQCLYASYKESGDRNFKSKTDDERREFFSNLCDPKNEIIEHASIALIKKGKLVGFSLVRPTHGENNGHLWIICILPEFRKKTLASSILRFAIVTLGKMGYQTMSLTVDCENTPAVNLYEKFKFERVWARLTYAWKKENAKKMKDEFLLSTEFSLERCDIEKFSKNWAIYSSFSEWDDFETRKKIISRMGDHINNTYWIWHRKTSRIGGLLLRPNGLGYLFFEPPFTDQYSVIRLLVKLLKELSHSNDAIYIYCITLDMVDDFLRCGLYPNEIRRRMIRVTENFNVEWDKSLVVKIPEKQDGEELAKIYMEAYSSSREKWFRSQEGPGKQNKDFETIKKEYEKLISSEENAKYPFIPEASIAVFFDNNGVNELIGGCLIALWREKIPIVYEIFVKPGHQGKGLGTKMLKHALTNLADKYEYLQLFVIKGNTSESVYYKLGFKSIEEVPLLIVPTKTD